MRSMPRVNPEKELRRHPTTRKSLAVALMPILCLKSQNFSHTTVSPANITKIKKPLRSTLNFMISRAHEELLTQRFLLSKSFGATLVPVRFRSPTSDINEVRTLFSISVFSDLSPLTDIATVHEEMRYC
jgi:hypothetical protein